MNSPEERKRFAEDELRKRGKFVDAPIDTPKQKLCRQASEWWEEVTQGTLKPLLQSLSTPSQYDRKGTQHLLESAFESRFNKYSKDECVTLLSIMHAEELEKQAYAMAEAGHIGSFVGKNLTN